ncbi:ankyrin repeat domain-containing protein, partial [Priestia megaterium]|uniref:ankyrin repeat domain-containing protein n=1 Tax=Priestia megaterium TaxID=1404 RepID=UPI002E22873B|nr:ankyrin repeat domain-containing protein [Priestia megaterium]
MDKKSVNKAIRNAIKLGDINEVKQLIGNDKEILNTMTSFGTWLHIATKKGQFEMVQYLINKGIDIDARGGTFDASSLNLAAGAGHLKIVKYLIEAGAELDVSLAKRNPLF